MKQLLCILLFAFAIAAEAQSTGASGAISGQVLDATGAVIPGAEVTVSNAITKYKAVAKSDDKGSYTLRSVPFNSYQIVVKAKGFQTQAQSLELRSAAPMSLNFSLTVASGSMTVDVKASAGDQLETTPSAHTDVDKSLIAELPVSNSSTGLSAVVTLATPGVAGDSNGLFHPQGEHADTSYSVDNQPITDQQSKVFSNQVALSTIDSMEVISGVAPAEYGDKASLVINTTTKSGLNSDGAHGFVNAGYGSFGTATGSLGLSLGGAKVGNFLAVDGINSGRYLDSPEFHPIHDHGNSQSVFERLDYQMDARRAFHLNISGARSWFQTPNDYDQQSFGQDQRQMQRSFNIAPGFTDQLSDRSLLAASAYLRQDRVGYYPSANAMSDRPATLSQQRRLTNAGLKLDYSYSTQRHDLKIGALFSHTFLSENFSTGLTDPLYNAPCVDGDGSAVVAPGVLSAGDCAGAGYAANPGFQSGLLAYDLTRGGKLFRFKGRTDVKQEALYAQDAIHLGDWSLSLGLRADNYNGLSSRTGIQPRTGLSYHIKKTATVLRASYGRFMLTPYNENLVLSSSTGSGGLASAAGAFGDQALKPGRRNHFETGLQQQFGGWLLVDASYFWKFTRGDFDFDTIFNTPLAFPIQWEKSKIDGVSVRVNMPEHHGLSAYTVLGHTRARFFGPEVGGILFNSPISAGAFRIDHDQAFEQNTHLQYRPGHKMPSLGFDWRYESGMVAGAVPDLSTILGFTADQQTQIGFWCGAQRATLAQPIASCASPNWGTSRIAVPANGKENDDSNPPRIAPRHMFDLTMGYDNLLGGDKRKLKLQLSIVNLTNEVALYNFMSTFSGTHFVGPRSYQLELGWSF